MVNVYQKTLGLSSPPVTPRMKKSSTERVRRWRARHAELNRERQRGYQRKYAGTAKGMLTEQRYDAKRRGNR